VLFVATPALLARVHRANVVRQILLPLACVPALGTCKRFLVGVAEDMPLEDTPLFEYQPAGLTDMHLGGMLLAHVQVEGAGRLKLRTTRGAHEGLGLTVPQHVASHVGGESCDVSAEVAARHSCFSFTGVSARGYRNSDETMVVECPNVSPCDSSSTTSGALNIIS
jgi:hypothetical protein